MNNEEIRQYNTVVLASLLHDIGKFFQKGDTKELSFSIGEKHPFVSVNFLERFRKIFDREFLDFSLLHELVLKHHEYMKKSKKVKPGFEVEKLLIQNAIQEYRHFAWLVSTADNLSAKERDGDVKWMNFRTRALASVFASIMPVDGSKPDDFYHKLDEFKLNGCFPEASPKNEVEENNKALMSMIKEFEVMEKESDSITTFEMLLTLLTSLVYKYTWAVPSCCYDRVPDVSLYDHLRTTSAIAACLYKYEKSKGSFEIKSINDKDEYKFKLLGGGFSGIQSYIYDIPNQSGAAKRLRSRSFMVNALLDAVTHFICHTFDIPLLNIIMSCGGRFYILLPNTAEVNEKLEECIRTIENEVFAEWGGEISIYTAAIDLTAREFRSFKPDSVNKSETRDDGACEEREPGIFDRVMKQLNIRLNNAKNKRFSRVLVCDGVWNTAAFEIDEDIMGKTLCKACRRRFVPIESSEDMCGVCKEEVELGRLLANAKYISFKRNEKGSFGLIKGYSFDIGHKADDVPKDAYLVHMLNEEKLEGFDKPYAIKYSANHIPKHIGNEDKIMLFDEIAEKASGKIALGYLKADVDNMGFIFSEGLRRDKAQILEEERKGKKALKNHSRNTISRISTLSRMSDLFFTGILNGIIKEKYPYVYTVYSGGDDLFLVGPWDVMLEAAKEINSQFKRFTGQNPFVCLSAGFTVEKPSYPVTRAAKEADEALEKAKSQTVKLEKEAGNQFFTGDYAVKWDSLEVVLEKAKELDGLYKEGAISSAGIMRLIEYCELYRSFIDKGDIGGLRCMPMLANDIGRNYSGSKDSTRRLRDELDSLRDKPDGNKILYYLAFIAGIVLDKNRKKRGGDGEQ